MRGLGADYASQIQASAARFNIPPSLALAVATTESHLDPNAISPKGAIGLFQLMPATAAGLHVDPNDPSQNITGGLTYLQQLYNQYGDWNTALIAYNEGPGALASKGIYPSSQAYADSILAAAGLNQPGTTPEFSDYSPATESEAAGMLDSLTTSTGLSGTSLAILAVVGIGVLIWMVRR
jgi:soluble lytic murein transglycosylase-like protein